MGSACRSSATCAAKMSICTMAGSGLHASKAVSLAEAAAEPFVGLMQEEYPQHLEYVAAIFARVTDNPRIVEEHDGWAGVFSAVDAGTGVAIALDAFSY